ncbi:MAG: hypothetical protein ACKVX7_13900 [Planctomycetota bacterium]
MVTSDDTVRKGLIRIRAANYREALDKIYASYGKDVRIVHTRTLHKGGLLGVMGGKEVEIYITPRASYEHWERERADDASHPGAAKDAPLKTGGNPSVALGAESATTDAHKITDQSLVQLSQRIQNLVEKQQQKLEQLQRQQQQQPHSVPQQPTAVPTALGTLSTSTEFEPANSDRMDAPVVNAQPGVPSPRPIPPIVRAAARLLDERGFSREQCAELIERLRRRNLNGSGHDPNECDLLARVHLAELVRPKIPPCRTIDLLRHPATPLFEGAATVDKAPDVVPTGARIVALVGTPGVGKTTTVAKLLVQLKLGYERKVGVLSIDNYRIGARDQLHRYAELIHFPVVIADAAAGIGPAIAQLQDCDLVFVDTAGTSRHEVTRFHDLKTKLRALGTVETHLCISATSAPKTLLQATKRFQDVGYDRLLVTRVDEAANCGHLLDVFQAARVPISYLTCGQNVPDDIHAASLERVEELLLGAPQ